MCRRFNPAPGHHLFRRYFGFFDALRDVIYDGLESRLSGADRVFDALNRLGTGHGAGSLECSAHDQDTTHFLRDLLLSGGVGLAIGNPLFTISKIREIPWLGIIKSNRSSRERGKALLNHIINLGRGKLRK